jgi:hypothetical protein
MNFINFHALHLDEKIIFFTHHLLAKKKQRNFTAAGEFIS